MSDNDNHDYTGFLGYAATVLVASGALLKAKWTNSDKDWQRVKRLADACDERCAQLGLQPPTDKEQAGEEQAGEDDPEEALRNTMLRYNFPLDKQGKPLVVGARVVFRDQVTGVSEYYTVEGWDSQGRVKLKGKPRKVPACLMTRSLEREAKEGIWND